MDPSHPTTQFFSKLRKLAATLESETAKLQHTFENRHKEADSETTARAMRGYHELNADIGNLKGQIQDQLSQQKTRVNEASDFIKSCRAMEMKVSKDIQTVRRHWEKYGYQAPGNTQRPNKTNGQETDADGETNSEEDEDGCQEEDEDQDGHFSSPPKPEQPVGDVLQTPQPSDFGLSDIQLKRALAGGADWCPEAPPMPEMSLPHPALNTPVPPMAMTPKWALRMDDDELQTPQMHDFGIAENTMCLNNDFTMALFQKNVDKPKRETQDIPTPVNSIMENLQTKANILESPEMPVLSTLGFKIKKSNGQCSPPAQAGGVPESPHRPGNLPTSPEVPVFQTPYMKRLVSSKKRQLEPVTIQTFDESHNFELPTPPRNGTTGSKCSWEYDVPEISILGADDRKMPEMPNLESVLGNSLQSKNAKILKMSEHEKLAGDPVISSLELDGPTQEFTLGTPRIRTSYDEPRTPEMPDLSSVTQDICKLLSQAQMKRTEVAVVQPNIRAEKDRRSPSPQILSTVSETEFQSLPGYLRQMTLSNLNKAVLNINSFIEQHGQAADFQMEQLKSIISVGAKAPVYILCLTELQRLKQVGGVRNTSVYKLVTHN
ncbi:spindle and kinetochore-associated protein 3 [Mugil cephalus]|uniref:spindle and kinetochore-associated protein 3 n=1 Tax=Mugil cephalus TaxID=48193 RepID=UPI001FB5CDA6|nr:spindle and kinetochore-associated protein 3 [Mugil cephalus]